MVGYIYSYFCLKTLELYIYIVYGKQCGGLLNWGIHGHHHGFHEFQYEVMVMMVMHDLDDLGGTPPF